MGHCNHLYPASDISLKPWLILCMRTSHVAIPSCKADWEMSLAGQLLPIYSYIVMVGEREFDRQLAVSTAPFQRIFRLGIVFHFFI